MKYNPEYYSSENFIFKFKKLLACRYENILEHKRRGTFSKEYQNKFPFSSNNIESTIKQWYAKKGKKPSIDKLMEICELLDCDIDYFLTEQTQFKQDNLNAMARTGLEEVTIDEICNLTTSEKHIVDALFSRSYGSTNIIKLIQQMLFYSHPNTKNKSKITLDGNLTKRDNAYEKLENELNSSEIREMLSYRLGIEMNDIIDSLSQDDNLSNEIYNDYKNKYFKQQIPILGAEDLPKLKIDENGNVTINTSDEIERLETNILKRLEEREQIGNIFEYQINDLKNSSDFSNIIKPKRSTMNENDYLELLREIEKKTR